MSFFQRPPAPPPQPRAEGRSIPGTPTRGGLYYDRRPRAPAPEPIGPPLGKLFDVRVDGRLVGHFDTRGMWVTKRGGETIVERQAPRPLVLSLLPEQKRLLRAAQKAATKAGAR